MLWQQRKFKVKVSTSFVRSQPLSPADAEGQKGGAMRMEGGVAAGEAGEGTEQTWVNGRSGAQVLVQWSSQHWAVCHFSPVFVGRRQVRAQWNTTQL